MSEENHPLAATLPPGRHGLPPEFVEQNRRARVLAAVADLLAAEETLTVGTIAKQAAISRGSIYELFANKEAAIAELLTTATDELIAAIREAAEPAAGYEAKVAAAIAAVFTFIDEKPNVARALIVCGPQADTATYSQSLDRVGGLLVELGRSQTAGRFIVGGCAFILHAAGLVGSVSKDLESELVAFVAQFGEEA